MMDSTTLLDVQDLQVRFHVRQGTATVINDLNLSLKEGETLGIVGESGCGKSMTALAIMGLVPSPPGEVSAGRIFLENEDLLQVDAKRMRQVRGNDISMIFQEPMTSLNPVFKIGYQIAETIRIHQGLDRRAALNQAIEMLKAVDIPAPQRRANEYPYQLSGGMRQRVMIAMALACNPKVLIADEPTTALDVTVQAQIFDLLREIQERNRAAIIFITHDMGSIAQMADRVAVMYAGRKVEDGPVGEILGAPQHPYTRGLIACVPHLEKKPSSVRRPLTEILGVVPSLLGRAMGCPFAPRCKHALQQCRDQVPPTIEMGRNHHVSCWLAAAAEAAIPTSQTVSADATETTPPEIETSTAAAPPLIRVRDLKIHFNRPRKSPFAPKSWVHAVDGVSFDIRRGTTFGIVGESGSGKTTTGLGLMRLNPITSGRIVLDGDDITKLEGEDLRHLRRRMQFIFQDPYSSLNPHMRTGSIVREPMDLLRVGTPDERDPRVADLFGQVGLRAEQQAYFPHQFSGGQRQRIGVARALASRPDLVICDEPVSALDVAIQAQILNLLSRLQKAYDLTYLFISHDLGVVQHICDEIAVMYLGQIVEQADRISLFQQPLHPYTRALLSAVPSAKPDQAKTRERVHLKGDPPNPIDPPPGCRFAQRCHFANSSKHCYTETPPLQEVAGGHKVACHLVRDAGTAPWDIQG
ncbi:MAG: ABC transporter ATP-binding protein [Thermodesulfobacteriota bacterium]